MHIILKNAHLMVVTFAILLCLAFLILPQAVSGAPQAVTPSSDAVVERPGETAAEAGTPEQPLEKITAAAKEKAEKPSKGELPLQLDELYFKKTPLPEPPSLKIFGHNFFSGDKTFSPISTLSVPDDYLIGPGDEIKVLTWGRMDSSHSLKVDNSGMVILPKVGQVTVGGLAFKEAEDLIKSRLGAISGVKVSVNMGELRAIQLFVLGEVKNPGVYTVNAPATVLNVLHASGGPTALGSLRKVELRRAGNVLARLDFYALMLEGNISADKIVRSGDIIFVPRTGPMVSVFGNVRRPAIYELKGNRTLETALNLAAGLKPTAYSQRIRITRALENRVQVVLDISGTEPEKRKKVQIQDGDLIAVSRILPLPVNGVYLYGNINRPGVYAFKPGSHIRDILPGMESLRLNSYLEYAVVRRYNLNNMDWELIPFAPGKLFLSKDETQNILLKPMDEIYIFAQDAFENRKYATVSGRVRKPGQHPLSKDMTIRDLIFKGGGLAPGAYTRRGELVQYDIVEGEKIKTSRFDFDVRLALQGEPAHNRKLRPLDEVYIKEIPGWGTRKKTITLSGQIRFPGTYQILKNEKLDGVIQRAGGVTPDAYPRGAVFARESVRKQEQQKMNDLIEALEIEIASLAHLEERAFLTEKDIAGHTYFISAQETLLARLREKKPTGRVVISLRPGQKSEADSNSPVLEDGDSLYVPKNPGTISVLGAVYSPAAYLHDKKHPDMAYYLAKSGGPTLNAQKDQIYVVRADGTAVSRTGETASFEKTALYPGDTIIVPHKGMRPAYISTPAMGENGSVSNMKHSNQKGTAGISGMQEGKNATSE